MRAAKRGIKAAAKPAAKLSSKLPIKRKAAAKRTAAIKPAQRTSRVLSELRGLAKELNKAARGLGKSSGGNPKEVSAILGNVERITAEAADKSLLEAENAKQLVATARDTLGHDWSRKDLDTALRGIGEHLTNIIVAQEFQDLAGQALRRAMKALVGAVIVVDGGGAAEGQRLSQKEVDSLLKGLMV